MHTQVRIDIDTELFVKHLNILTHLQILTADLNSFQGNRFLAGLLHSFVGRQQAPLCHLRLGNSSYVGSFLTRNVQGTRLGN